MTVLFFEAIARHAVWGNTLVKDYFGYHEMPDGTGQTWAFSTDKKGSNRCLTEPFRGMSLHDLWQDHQELFQREGKPFPVIISLVGPEDNLSVQIHPDSRIAAKMGWPMGKNEAWYFLDCIPGAEIVYGHQASSEEEFRKMAQKDQWDSLLRHLPVKKDDFVYTPAGTVHGVGRGCVTYEIQQATDITYRLYDYHRVDTDGKERPMNFEEGVRCISSYPQKHEELPSPVVIPCEGGDRTVMISNDSFTVTRLRVAGRFYFNDENYQLATVVKGTGKINNITISIGDSFLIPCGESVVFQGTDLMIMMTRN
jgi:mannose-6-phosphate isomerase